MQQLSISDYRSDVEPTWCPGCGDFPILSALQQGLVELDIAPHEVLLVSGIGQISKLPNYIRANGFHTIHGRPLPVATGAKLANQELNVIVTAGDGDSYAIGGNHFIHTCRRNLDITHVVGDNQIYGLTKGQYSPTSEQGFVTKTTPEGSIEPPVNPVKLALANDASFVARAFSGKVKHLRKILMEAIEHTGYALVDVFQPCVTFNRVNTYDFFNERVYELGDRDHDPSDQEAAYRRAEEWGEEIPIGVFFRESRPTYEEQIPALEEQPLVKQEIDRSRREDLDFDSLKSDFI
ncbi:MAG: 2-oxoacid:ferredoxin oxidoreductase subunit beta [Candidatus Bipolaricaulota bacterium]